jgi:hypothetical protein
VTLAPCLLAPSRSVSPSALADVVGSRVCSDGGSILLFPHSTGSTVKMRLEGRVKAAGGLMRGERQQFVTQIDGLPFRQASERKQCGAKGLRRCPELFHLDAVRIRTD